MEMALVAGERACAQRRRHKPASPTWWEEVGNVVTGTRRSLGSPFHQNIAAQKVTHFHVGEAKVERNKLSEHKCEAIANEEDKSHGLACFCF